MKKMFFVCLTLLLASCQEPYEKAIDEYYQSHLHDPSSYELVKMVGPDSVTVTSAAVDMFLMQTDLTDEERTLGLTRYLLQLKSKGKDVDAFVGYRFIHEYRAKNKVGALTLHRDLIYFDKTMTKIADVQQYGK